MKKLSLTAFAAAGLMAVSAPAFAATAQTAHHHAAHHQGKAHKKGQSKKADAPVSKTDELNAMSLQKAQTPVLTPPAVVTVPQKEAQQLQKESGNAVMPVVPMTQAPSASVMPAPMPAPAAQ
ncbi:hypothetical protein PT277_04355 [Acetobacteraceae bacterium ESL0709]|nr:hypothetical protein [Acetobacteraceae bacterium ESL0697]MDF7677929.1 hypothetical protein [Acetobacteraceae bacterium ESL0709]